MMKQHEGPTMMYFCNRDQTPINMITTVERAAAKMKKLEEADGIPENKQMMFAKCDAAMHDKIPRRLNLKALPTIILIRNGAYVDDWMSYTGDVMWADNIVSWAQKNGRDTIRATELEKLQDDLEDPKTNFTQYVFLLDLKQSNDRDVLEYAKTNLPKAVNSFTTKADVWGVYDYLYMDDMFFEDIGKTLDVHETSLIAFYPVKYKQDPKNKKLEYKVYPLGLMPDDADDKRVWFETTMEWVLGAGSQPSVYYSDYTSSSLTHYREEPSLQLYSEKFADPDTRQLVYDSLLKVSNIAGIKGKCFFNMHERTKHFAEKLRIREDSIDMEQDFILYNDRTTDPRFHYIYKMKQKDFYSTQEIGQFLKDIYAKKVKPFVRSKRVVKKRKKGEPISFSGSDVYSKIYKAKKEQIILLYHSNSQKSQTVLAEWQKVSRYLHRHMPEVEVGQLDYRHNDVRHRALAPAYMATYMEPRIHYFAKDNRTHPTMMNVSRITGTKFGAYNEFEKFDYQVVLDYITAKRENGLEHDEPEWENDGMRKIRERQEADQKRKERLAQKAQEREEAMAAEQAGDAPEEDVEEAEL